MVYSELIVHTSHSFNPDGKLRYCTHTSSLEIIAGVLGTCTKIEKLAQTLDDGR